MTPETLTILIFIVNAMIAASAFTGCMGQIDPERALFALIIADGFGMLATLTLIFR